MWRWGRRPIVGLHRVRLILFIDRIPINLRLAVHIDTMCSSCRSRGGLKQRRRWLVWRAGGEDVAQVLMCRHLLVVVLLLLLLLEMREGGLRHLVVRARPCMHSV